MWGEFLKRKKKMEKMLSEASVQGNVVLLQQILEEDPLILDKIIVLCISETPLHTASMLGHLHFVKALLNRKPELATELDSNGCSPLHLATAKGHVKVVKELLSADSQVGFVRNSDGRTALHVAVIKGRVAAAIELVRAVPELTRVLTDRGETCLHLCVKYNKVEMLHMLAEAIKMNEDLVNWKDCDGNTIFHVTVAKKQIEMINSLLKVNGLEMNALNKNGLTALDILSQSPRDLRDMEIESSLQKADASSAKDLHLITDDWIQEKVRQSSKTRSLQQSNTKKPDVKQKHRDWLGRKRSALMVVASLIATVAFQAGLTPPGGVWQEDYTVDKNGNPVSNPHTVGQSIMAYKEPKTYGIFMIFNTIAFLSSLSIILLLVSGLPLKRRRWMWVQMVIVWIAISAQVATYIIIFCYMSSRDVKGVFHEVAEISILTWLTLMGVVFIGNMVRMNLWILRKYGYFKEKEIPLDTIEDDQDDAFK